MDNNRNLPQKGECCPKIVIYTEDFYMTFGNCQAQKENCSCGEIDGYKNLLKMLFDKREKINLFF